MVVAIVHWTGSAWVAGTFVNNTFVPGQWSEPVAVTGEQGTDGQYVDFKFCATTNMNAPPWNSTLANMLNPTGWLDQPPQLPASGAIWMIEAWKQAGGTQLITAWSTPVRISGEKGQDGQDGANGNFTSFVFKLSDTQPATPSGTNPIPAGWSDAPTGGSSNISYIGHEQTWALQSDGTRKSPVIYDNGFTKNRINFTTSQSNQVITIFLKVSSEAGYDFALVGLLDNPNLSRTSNYSDRISGTAEKYISINVTTAGSHYIDIGYAKDGSQSTGQDCAWYSISAGSVWWMSKATVSYQGGQWLAGAWSAPVKVTGEDGEAGQDGKFWDYKYRTASSQPATPSGLSPAGWSDQPPAVTAGNYLWMSYCEKNAAQTQILWGWSTPVQISGEKGQTGNNGQDGAYFEYRYAKNGSTTAPPALSTTSTNPSGWTTTMPSLGSLEYLWMTVAKKSAAGSILQNWSTPTRTTGTPGAPGLNGANGIAGPSVVFRGEYNSSANYYGTSTRVDCVKYNSNYYVARIDAGNGFNVVPTNVARWNTFGAQFDSVATNLLLAEFANIADWVIKSAKITSQNNTSDGTPRAQLDGQNGAITLASDISTYTASGGSQSLKQTIKIESQSGNIESRTPSSVAYLTSQGFFANRAGTQALPASSGIELKAAVVALGNGDLQRTAYSSLGAICGVYGSASNSNSNPAPAFGGYFFNLMARGLNLGVKTLSNSDDNYSPFENDCFFSCYNTAYITLYFRTPQSVGKIYYIRINNSATVNINTSASGGKQIMLQNGSLVNSYSITTRGSLASIIWDGSYWLYNQIN